MPDLRPNRGPEHAKSNAVSNDDANTWPDHRTDTIAHAVAYLSSCDSELPRGG